MKKLFVWDLHGTLEIGSEIGFANLLNLTLQQFGYSQRLEAADALLLHGKNMKEYLDHLLPDVILETKIAMQHRARKMAAAEPSIILQSVEPTPYAHHVLAKIAERQVQALISNVSHDALTLYLEHVHISHYFPEYAFALVQDPAAPSRTKQGVLETILASSVLYDSIVTIGDSCPDVSLTARIPITSYLFAHPDREFRECSATYKIRDLREVLREV